MSGDLRIEIQSASVCDKVGMFPDLLYVQYLCDKGKRRGNQGNAGFCNQNQFLSGIKGSKRFSNRLHIIVVIRLVRDSSVVTASHIHILEGKIKLRCHLTGRRSEGPVDLDRPGTGGGMEVEPGDSGIGDLFQAADHPLQLSAFIGIAEAAAFFLRQNLVRTEQRKIKVDPQSDFQDLVRMPCTKISQPFRLPGGIQIDEPA